MSQYQHLFTPIQLGPVRVRNRVVFSAHLTNYAQGNAPSQKLIDYYRERARGGAGLIITEVHVATLATADSQIRPAFRVANKEFQPDFMFVLDIPLAAEFVMTLTAAIEEAAEGWGEEE